MKQIVLFLGGETSSSTIFECVTFSLLSYPSRGYLEANAANLKATDPLLAGAAAAVLIGSRASARSCNIY